MGLQAEDATHAPHGQGQVGTAARGRGRQDAVLVGSVLVPHMPPLPLWPLTDVCFCPFQEELRQCLSQRPDSLPLLMIILNSLQNLSAMDFLVGEHNHTPKGPFRFHIQEPASAPPRPSLSAHCHPS